MFPSRTNPPIILSILYILSKKQSQPRLNGVAMCSSPRGRGRPVADLDKREPLANVPP